MPPPLVLVLLDRRRRPPPLVLLADDDFIVIVVGRVSRQQGGRRRAGRCLLGARLRGDPRSCCSVARPKQQSTTLDFAGPSVVAAASRCPPW